MNITSAKYTKTGSIEAIIDGSILHIPDDMGNRHRIAIQEWVDNGGTIDLYIEEINLSAYNAEKRWEKENDGIIINGMPVFTDDRSKMMILGARLKAEGDPLFTTRWKTANGDFIEIDSLTIVMISEAVLNFVERCFAKESEIDAMITAGTMTTKSQINEEWNTVSNVT